MPKSCWFINTVFIRTIVHCLIRCLLAIFMNLISKNLSTSIWKIDFSVLYSVLDEYSIAFNYNRTHFMAMYSTSYWLESNLHCPSNLITKTIFCLGADFKPCDSHSNNFINFPLITKLAFVVLLSCSFSPQVVIQEMM